jgi:hypothetical protein
MLNNIGIEYERSMLVLHTDQRLMPKTRSDWKSVNFILENKNNSVSTPPQPLLSPSGRAVRYLLLLPICCYPALQRHP